MASEIWKPVADWEGFYEVSNLGRIRSVVTGTIRKTQSKSGARYQLVGLIHSGRKKTYSVHRLIAEAFLGPMPAGKQCAHLNGDPSDNRAANLAYVTAKENASHKRFHGTHKAGESHHAAVLTETDVLELRATVHDLLDAKVAAERHGIAPSSICAAVNGKTWAHLPGAHPVKRIGRGLGPDAARYIRRHPHIPQNQLARKFGVSKTAIYYVRTGRNWAGVE